MSRTHGRTENSWTFDKKVVGGKKLSNYPDSLQAQDAKARFSCLTLKSTGPLHVQPIKRAAASVQGFLDGVHSRTTLSFLGGWDPKSKI